MNPSRTTGTRAAAAADDHADERRDLQPADRGEHADRIGRVGALTASARSIMATLCARPSSSMPVPAR